MSGKMVPNVRTPEASELGEHLARLADVEEAKNSGARKRCHDCAFRGGPHIANGSPATLMNALKCAMERKTFWCHHVSADGRQQACAGWRLIVSDVNIPLPWDFVNGADIKETAP